MPRSHARAAMLVAALAASVSAGCTMPSGVTVEPTGEVAFPRTLQADRMVEVRVFTSDEVDGIVTAAALSTPAFADVGTVDTNVRLTAGWAARLRIPLGEAVCPAPPGDATVEVHVAGADGSSAVRTVVLAAEVLAQINAAECDDRIATDAAAPRFLASGTPDATGWDTSIVVERGPSDAEARVTRLAGNVIFDLRPVGEPLPALLAADQDALEIPVRIVATRCDAHAFAESKKTFVFPAWIEVDGVERSVDYRATGAARAQLQALFDQCGVESESDGIGGQ